ncbi:hypothetical protein AB6B38_10070 [Glycocaulis abyssi]|uniref:Uncharacterized protein n=1 Tax=Glycocaulis abyssi TaxID=1433403 RepID=A0ABV9NBK7_9PROT
MVQEIVSIGLAGAIVLMPVAGFVQRICLKKGIGWQFIRFNVIAMSLPLVGLLALNDALTGEVATIVAAAMAYSFGKSGEKE